MNTSNQLMSFGFGLLATGVIVGMLLCVAILESLDGGSKYHQEGYTQGVKDCMAGESKAIITTDTIVAYPSR